MSKIATKKQARLEVLRRIASPLGAYGAKILWLALLARASRNAHQCAPGQACASCELPLPFAHRFVVYALLDPAHR